ncbi:MAG: hypothetical protein F4Z77_00995 [Dehalococcoidia bacterium]|nr:hypothetical protein [Dehalococcoidia bacterium]
MALCTVEVKRLNEQLTDCTGTFTERRAEGASNPGFDLGGVVTVKDRHGGASPRSSATGADESSSRGSDAGGSKFSGQTQVSSPPGGVIAIWPLLAKARAIRPA